MNNPEPCRFWLHGTCSFGDRCRKSHNVTDSTTSSPTLAHRGKLACRFFLMGECKNGDLCQFSHSIRNEDTIKPKSSTVCKYFRLGRCSNVKCPFEHVGDKTSSTWRTKSSAPVKTSIYRPQSNLSFPPTFGTPVPCKYFQKGCCTNQQCPFVHIIDGPTVVTKREEKQQAPYSIKDSTEVESKKTPSQTESESPNPGHTTVHMNDEPARTLVKYGCKVDFGPGASVRSITTAFESRTIVISNIPSDTSRNTLMEVLEHFGHIKNIGIDLTTGTARVEFVESSQAASAVENLTDYEFGASALLSARFDLTAIETGPATLRSTKVKLTWFAPSVIAWAHYNTVSKARAEAQRLDGLVFNESKIGATFQLPGVRQTTSFSVVIVGLPLQGAHHATWSQGQLKTFAHAASITVGRPTYDLMHAVDKLGVLLRESGNLESFEVMPASGKKITGWAQFTTSDAAVAAIHNMHKSTPFGGKIQLWMEHIHSFKYTLPRLQFNALKGSFDQLRATAEAGSQLRYYDKDERGLYVDPVCVRLYSSEPKILGKMKVELEREMQGKRLDGLDGVGVWDEFFLTPPGKAFTLSVFDQTQIYAKCDARSRSIRLYGSEGLLLAKAIMDAKVSELRAQHHVIVLEKDILRTLLAGGFKTILEQCADGGKVVLNIVTQTISVTGDKDYVEKARRAIQRLKLGRLNDTDSVHEGGESLCPVCFCEVAEPTTLPCGHVYDAECLCHLIKSAITSDFASVQCVKEVENGRICSIDVPHSIIQGLLTGDEETQLLEASMRAHMHTRPHEFHYCPTPDCPTVYRPSRAGTVLRCVSCLERFCPNCHVEYHEGLSCEEYKDGMSTDLQLFQKWREENGIKSCPECNADIQKNGGCNHITCVRCKTHICWVCMKSFTDDDSSNGVYSHMRRAHGGIM